jgi:fumarate hydratase subunit alpha
MMHDPSDPRLVEAVAEATAQALFIAETRLPEDVKEVISRAHAKETNPVARREFVTIWENIMIAEKAGVPICQDTGVPVLYITLPPTIPLTGRLYEALAEGVRRATCDVPLRPKVVDPLTRKNRGDNVGNGMPAVHVRPGDQLTITVLPKGAGAENTSRIVMLLPSERERIPEVVAETVCLAGGKPCPPVVLGVGIGGTFDLVAALAKEALLLPINTMDPYEQQICDRVNNLGIGPMGLGGNTTALAVKVQRADCHTASLPVAVNVQCWAHRRATVEVDIPW